MSNLWEGKDLCQGRKDLDLASVDLESGIEGDPTGPRRYNSPIKSSGPKRTKDPL